MTTTDAGATTGDIPNEIRTERLTLRQWRAADAAVLHPILVANQTHFGSWIPTRVSSVVPEAELAERLEGFAREAANGREYRYAVVLNDTGELIGEADLFPRDAHTRVHLTAADRMEIGYWLRSDVTGRGYATEAARALFDVAARTPGMTSVEIRCDSRNLASVAIPSRLGFTLASSEADGSLSGGTLQVWVRPT